LQVRPALGRDVADVRRIGGIGDPVPERRDIAMLKDECRKRDRTALPFDGSASAGFDGVIVQDRRIVAAGGATKQYENRNRM